MGTWLVSLMKGSLITDTISDSSNGTRSLAIIVSLRVKFDETIFSQGLLNPLSMIKRLHRIGGTPNTRRLIFLWPRLSLISWWGWIVFKTCGSMTRHWFGYLPMNLASRTGVIRPDISQKSSNLLRLHLSILNDCNTPSHGLNAREIITANRHPES